MSSPKSLGAKPLQIEAVAPRYLNSEDLSIEPGVEDWRDFLAVLGTIGELIEEKEAGPDTFLEFFQVRSSGGHHIEGVLVSIHNWEGFLLFLHNTQQELSKPKLAHEFNQALLRHLPVWGRTCPDTKDIWIYVT